MRYTVYQRKLVFSMKKKGISVSQISKETSIPQSTIYSWLRKSEKNTSYATKENFTYADYCNLIRRYEKAKAIIEVLKSVHCTNFATTREKLYALEKLYGKYTVYTLCEALDIPRGTFYNHVLRNKKNDTAYTKHREELKPKIQAIFDESGQIYGARKIASILRKSGQPASDEMVLQLMREMGLASMRKNAKKNYKKDNLTFDDHVKQNFDVSCPNQVWVGDITYYMFKSKVFYICAVMDLFSRKIVGYKISGRQSTQLVKSTFLKAFHCRGCPDHLIFHSDRGSAYQSIAYRDCLIQHGVTQSFSRSHTPHDNAVIESFFNNLKSEELYRMRYRSEKEFENALGKYIEYYNKNRPHSRLKYKSPDEYEQIHFSKGRVQNSQPE